MEGEAKPTHPVKPNSSYAVGLKGAYRVRAFWQDSALWYDTSICETVLTLKEYIIKSQNLELTTERLIIVH